MHAQEIEEVVVTGSRIPRDGFVTPAPVTVLDADEIRDTGAVTLGELLNQLPQLGTTFSLGNSTRFIGTAGLSLLDLRNLGTERTLVLVNGRRHVGASAGSTEVDTNTIPVEWIERVEVMTGGASAIYGADAVTGVVNFVLRDTFEGVSVRGQTGGADDSSFGRSFVSLTAGSNFADDRGSAAISLERSEQDRMRFVDREIGRINWRGLPNPDAPPAEILVPNAGLSGITSGGVFSLDDEPHVFDPDGSFRPQRFDGIQAPGECSDCDFLDINSTEDLQPALRRSSFNTMINYALTPQHELFFEGKYVKTTAEFFSQPAFGFAGDAYLIPRDNAYISPQLGAAMDAAGQDSITVNRFDVDAGLRGEDVTRETTRLVLGVDGELGGNWNYGVSAVYGRLLESRANLNNRINARFYASIDAVADPDSGEIVCRSTLEPEESNINTDERIPAFAREDCVPTSIFGEGAVDAEAAEFFNTTSLAATEITQTVATATVSQDELFTLPAGPAGFAAGLEYREEESEQTTDALSAAGLTFLNAIPDQGGKYDVSEAFAELSLPLLAGVAAVENLTFDVASRFSDYSTVGSTAAWKAGLDWTITPAVRMRGTVTRAVRAPNISELFDPQSQNFFSIADPCSAEGGNQISNAPDPELRQANCNALGVPTGFVSTFQATREGVSGGNPDLSEEESDAVTIGVVFTPPALPDFGLSIDYWDITIEDAIDSVSGEQLAIRCVDAAGGIDNEFCSSIARDPDTHEIVFVTAIAQNLSRLDASGIDFELGYGWNELFGGELDLRLVGTYVDKHEVFPFQSFPDEVINNRGTIDSPNPGVAKWRGILTANYQRGGLTVNWRTRYIDSLLRVSNEVFEANPQAQSPIETGSRAYTDLQLGYALETGPELYVGIDNLFDRDPPIGLFGTGAGSALYDNIGRFYYAGLAWEW